MQPVNTEPVTFIYLTHYCIWYLWECMIIVLWTFECVTNLVLPVFAPIGWPCRIWNPMVYGHQTVTESTSSFLMHSHNWASGSWLVYGLLQNNWAFGPSRPKGSLGLSSAGPQGCDYTSPRRRKQEPSPEEYFHAVIKWAGSPTSRSMLYLIHPLRKLYMKFRICLAGLRLLKKYLRLWLL